MYVMEIPIKWEYYLHLAKFAFNNGYQASAKMSPFEIMYEKKCISLVNWDRNVDHLIIGPEMLEDIVCRVGNPDKIQH